MDTSETYIKMTLALPNHMVERLEEIGARWFYVSASNCTVRLFEQDQLQEMIKDRIDWSQDFYRFWYEFWGEHCNSETGVLTVPGWAAGIKEPIAHGVMQFNSWEQLWLAFVMKELHQKQWNGEVWVKK